MKQALDEWIIGMGSGSTRQYLVHTISPRFTAEILPGKPWTLVPFSFALGDGRLLGDFEFLDEPPQGEEWEKLLDEIIAALS